MKPILISSGEPAGIGPDICLALAGYKFPIVVLADLELLKRRAKLLNLSIEFEIYYPDNKVIFSKNKLYVWPVPGLSSTKAGVLDKSNAHYVINMLNVAAEQCLIGNFTALVTAPVHKGIINAAGINFTGHTEFFSEIYKIKQVVMLLVCPSLKVALVTTHIPLKTVAGSISQNLVIDIITILNRSLTLDFALTDPKIAVAGLNPHAGENGYLGTEEIDIIAPAIKALQNKGLDIIGPLPADTIFIKPNLKKYDCFVAMYHDQGLAVLKHKSFGRAVNVTLGLPIIRTSVDHGTALDLAGTKEVDPRSMLAALRMAIAIGKRHKNG